MDEDEFRKQFMKTSVFKQASSLDYGYVPEKLHCRDETIKSLIFNYRHILEKIEQPSVNCVLLGRGGTGKTVTAKFFGNVIKATALEKGINVFIEYINCITTRSLKAIIKELIKRRGHTLLIIDEVSILKAKQVLELLNISETLNYQKNEPLKGRLSLLLISRSQEWMKIETEQILSRLNQKIILKPYSYEETFQILEYRAELAFKEKNRSKENVLNEELLEMVSQIVMEYKNLRHGIEIFRKSGLMADKKGIERISADMIRWTSNEVYPTFRADVIDQLNNQELLALYGIIASLLHTDEAFTVVDEAYDEYETICETYGVEPHVKMTFRKYVRTLNQLKMIASKTVRIEEAERGRHSEIRLLDITAEKLEEVLIDLFDKRFG